MNGNIGLGFQGAEIITHVGEQLCVCVGGGTSTQSVKGTTLLLKETIGCVDRVDEWM